MSSDGRCGGTSSQRGIWNVMVTRLLLLVAWPDSPVFNLPIVLPPVVLPSTSASHIWAAMTRHPLFMAVFGARTELFSRSHFAVDLFETDAAYANEKVIYFHLAYTIFK